MPGSSTILYLGIVVAIIGLVIGLAGLIYWVSTKDTDALFWILLILGIVVFIGGLIMTIYGMNARRKASKASTGDTEDKPSAVETSTTKKTYMQ